MRASKNDGFTLLELVVSMGILTGFLLMLVQLMTTGTGLVDVGERGQELADRGHAAVRAVRRVTDAMVGSRSQSVEDGVDARLLVHWAQFPLKPEGQFKSPVVRSTIRIDPRTEAVLISNRVRAELEASFGNLDEEALQDEIQDRLAETAFHGRGEALMVARPADPEGVFLELHQATWTLDGPAEGVRLLEMQDPRDLELSQAMLLETRVVARGLLHFGVELWSQRTRSWNSSIGTGAEESWDSCRAGLLIDAKENDPEFFALDVGPSSLKDPRDDIWPRWIRVTLVVARSPDEPPEAFLAQGASESERELRVDSVDDLPAPSETKWLKVGSEWIRYGDMMGTTLTGVRRGRRGTEPRSHDSGTDVRAGREIVMVIQLPHAKDGDDF